jgi:hypothetical protein
MFFDPNPRPNASPAVGLYLINSRFNHSYIPNIRAPNHIGDTKENFITKDIDAAEAHSATIYIAHILLYIAKFYNIWGLPTSAERANLKLPFNN